MLSYGADLDLEGAGWVSGSQELTAGLCLHQNYRGRELERTGGNWSRRFVAPELSLRKRSTLLSLLTLALRKH